MERHHPLIVTIGATERVAVDFLGRRVFRAATQLSCPASLREDSFMLPLSDYRIRLMQPTDYAAISEDAPARPLPPRGNRLVRRRPPTTPMPAPPAGVSMLGTSAPGPGPNAGSVVPGTGPRLGNSMIACRCGAVESSWA